MLTKSKLSLINRRLVAHYSDKVPQALRSKKPKSQDPSTVPRFLDLREVRVVGGNGGDGCISFLSLWRNEFAGPDGGDGGHGGHVIFRAAKDLTNLGHVTRVVEAPVGEQGMTRDCNGKNAEHTIVPVPVGTVVKDDVGKVVGDLDRDGMLFVAAKGGAGGKGNHFFVTDVQQAPKCAEYGGEGEQFEYLLELKSMAHLGLIGFPNAGKSTLLRAVSRARPKVAPYPFTTLSPSLGMIQYDDYEQLAIADLPGLIPNSHKNKGLGIQFLKHVERCMGLLYVIDMSLESPWEQLSTLQNELKQYNANLKQRPQLLVANKMDLPGTGERLQELRTKTDLPVIEISAKLGTNVTSLLHEIRVIYDKYHKPNK